MTIPATLALSVALAVSAQAQEFAPVDAAAKAGLAANAASRQSNRQKTDREIIDATLTAMNDANPAGEYVVGYLRHYGIDVAFATQPEPSKMTAAGGATRITLSDTLPKYPRVLAPYIALAAMPAKLEGYPDCAEREYMVRSVVARTWIELGGDRNALPLIEPLIGHNDPSLAATMEPWTKYSGQMILEKVGQASGKRELAEVCAGAKTAGETAACAHAETYFIEFMSQEREWRQLFPGR